MAEENWFTGIFDSAWDEINTFYTWMTDSLDELGDKVKEEFGKIIKGGRNLRLSTISQMITRAIKD